MIWVPEVVPVPIDDLFEIARLMQIRVTYYPAELTGAVPRARYKESEGSGVIFLSHELDGDPMRTRCKAAHEIAHAATGALGLMPHDEARANRWAQDLLMPDWWLKEKSWMPPWMLCEEAGVYQIWAEDRLRRFIGR